jgi:hypothetical protein
LEAGQRVEVVMADRYDLQGIPVQAGRIELRGVSHDEHGRAFRYAAPGARVAGIVATVDDDWLMLDLGDGEPPVGIPRRAIRRWENFDLPQGVARPPAAGERIRLVSPEFGPHKVTGRLLEVDDDTLLLKLPNRAEPVRLQRSSVERLDVSRGVHGRTRLGAMVGGVAVGALGGLAGYGIGRVSGPADCVYDCRRPTFWGTVIGGVTGAGIGVAIGALAGTAVRIESWRPASIAVSLAPRRKGGMAALTLRF